MKTLMPRTPLQVWLTTQALRLGARLPATVQRRLSAFQGRPARALSAVTLKQYGPPPWPSGRVPARRRAGEPEGSWLAECAACSEEGATP